MRTLLIDRSAESVESSLPVRGETWRRTREHQSSVHSSDSSRDASRRSSLTRFVNSSRSSRRGCHAFLASSSSARTLISCIPSRITAVAAVLKPSSVVSTPTVCLVSLFALHYWAAADLVDVLVITGSGGSSLPQAWFAFFRNCCTQDLKSRSASFGVSLTLSLSRHTVYTELLCSG